MIKYKPIWKFNYKDKSTWKYSDYDIKRVDGEVYIKWIKNNKFAYEYLSPYGKEIVWNIVEERKKCP